MKSLAERVRLAQQELMGNSVSNFSQAEYRLQEDLELGNEDVAQHYEDTAEAVLIGGIEPTTLVHFMSQ